MMKKGGWKPESADGWNVMERDVFCGEGERRRDSREMTRRDGRLKC